MVLEGCSVLSTAVVGAMDSLRLMAQDAVGADAWLAMGMWAQGSPGWFQAGLEQGQCTYFLRQVLWFVRFCCFDIKVKATRGQQCKSGG